MTQPVPTVTVEAHVERDVAPDTWTLTATAVGTGRQIKAALASLGELYRALEDAAGGLPDAIEIGHHAVSTERGHPPEYPARATRSLIARSHDLGLVGSVAEAFAAVGSVEVDGPEWALDKDNAVYVELQTEVVHAARERAARYATAGNATLGPVVEIRDLVGEGRHRSGARSLALSALGAAPQLAGLDWTPAPITVSAGVQATWSLVPADTA